MSVRHIPTWKEQCIKEQERAQVVKQEEEVKCERVEAQVEDKAERMIVDEV
jgi:hypothetical protein